MDWIWTGNRWKPALTVRTARSEIIIAIEARLPADNPLALMFRAIEKHRKRNIIRDEQIIRRSCRSRLLFFAQPASFC